jgi:hypothetical protein
MRRVFEAKKSLRQFPSQKKYRVSVELSENYDLSQLQGSFQQDGGHPP